MSRRGVLILALMLLSCAPGMNVKEQARALGNDPFHPEKWAAADQEARGRMVLSFLDMHRPESLSAQQIRKLLGNNTGYHDYDEYPTYRVGSTDGHGKEYLLIFVVDHQTGRVKHAMLVPTVSK